MAPHGERIRFVDLLTMASAVAGYLGAQELTPEHVVAALDVLEGSMNLEDLGRQAVDFGLGLQVSGRGVLDRPLEVATTGRATTTNGACPS